MSYTVPVLSCEEAFAFERSFLRSETAEWDAMLLAGISIAEALPEDYRFWRERFYRPTVVVFAGKGHNAADAILAAVNLKTQSLVMEVEVAVIWCFGKKGLKPLLKKSVEMAEATLGDTLVQMDWSDEAKAFLESKRFDLSLDGIVGMQFNGEWRGDGAAIVSWMNGQRDRLGFRVAVDLPSGLGDTSSRLVAQADITYATGILKRPALDSSIKGDDLVGRLRYLDLGFFDRREDVPKGERHFLSSELLNTIGRLRDASSYKSSHGRVGILGGSPQFPGAVLLATQAAVRSGAGLVTALIPNAYTGPFASVLPEAMWRGLECDQDGSFGPRTSQMISELCSTLDAIVIGPGMAVGSENLKLLRELVAYLPCSLVLDAGALVPNLGELLVKRSASLPPVVLTPHIGEFRRLVGDVDDASIEKVLKEKAQEWGAVIVLKGPVTRITDGVDLFDALAGNPVLARGGSGDMLAGMLGARLAIPGADVFLAAQEAVVWHGAAADSLARERGEVGVSGSELLDYLGVALRS